MARNPRDLPEAACGSAHSEAVDGREQYMLGPNYTSGEILQARSRPWNLHQNRWTNLPRATGRPTAPPGYQADGGTSWLIWPSRRVRLRTEIDRVEHDGRAYVASDAMSPDIRNPPLFALGAARPFI